MSEEQNIDPKTDTIVDNTEDTATKLFKAKEYFKSFFLDVIDLDHGVDKLAVINEIKSKNSMSGANAWMLMCSIVIASIGLDLDSQAVIIGAMLISPLMSPILGIGLSVGINDMNSLKKSLAHFAIAILIALVTSTIYFWLSPFDQVTSQIQARTEPTFLDVIIAFFGGIAGIISNARKDISTTIPGVAIATALMPPLCVTGFGIANADSWDVALSSFYLFFVNTFFVALATFIIVRFLKFPYMKYMDPKIRRRNLMYVAAFSLLVSIPSFVIFKTVWSRINSERDIQTFVEEVIGENKIYLDDYEFIPGDSINSLMLKVYGDKINAKDSKMYNEELARLDIENTIVQIIPTSEINLDRINQLETEISGVQQMANKLSIIQKEKAETDEALQLLKNEIGSYSLDSLSFNKLCQELKALHTDISEVHYAAGQQYNYETYSQKIPIIIVSWNTKDRRQKERQQQVDQFLSVRFDSEEVKVVHEVE